MVVQASEDEGLHQGSNGRGKEECMDSRTLLETILHELVIDWMWRKRANGHGSHTRAGQSGD